MALRLCDIDITLKAAGLLRKTEAGWSFVVIVSAELDPAIDIPGTGILLTGVGGLAGINVGLSVDALRAGLHDGAVGRLLFPADPVANAPGDRRDDEGGVPAEARGPGRRTAGAARLGPAEALPDALGRHPAGLPLARAASPSSGDCASSCRIRPSRWSTSRPTSSA